jgi:PAS domain S-box-containing protein
MQKTEPNHVQPNSGTTMGSAAACSFSGCIMPAMASSGQGSERLNAQLLVDSIPALIHTARPDGYLDYFNKPWLEYLGVTLDKVTGWNWTAFVHPEDVEGILAKWRACLATGEVFEYETRVRRADGQYRWMFHRKVPLRDANGNIVKWYGSSLDIEERKTAEEKLRRSERDLHSIIETIPTMVWSAAPDGSVAFFNPRWLDYTGLSPDQSRDWRWAAAIHPDDLSLLTNAWQSILVTGEPGETEARLRRFDGAYRCFLFRANPLRDESGKIVKWYGTNVDIEDRKRAEEELRRSEFYLSEGQRLAHIGSWVLDPAGCFPYWSYELFRIYGLDPAREGPSFEEYLASIHPQDREFMRSLINRMIAEASGCDVTKRIVRPSGEVRYVRCVGVPIVENGTLKRIVGSAIDVTEHELLTQELRRHEAYLTEAQRLSHTGSFGWRPDTGEIVWSDETYRIFEYDRSVRPTIDSVMQRVHPQDRADFQKVIDGASRGATDFEHTYRLLLPDGRVKHVHAIAHALQDASGNREFVGAATDITEQRHAEAVIREQEAELRDVIDTIPAIVWCALPDGSNTYVNKRFVGYSGSSAEQMAGSGWQALIHPDDVERHAGKWMEAVATGKPLENEVRSRRSDGQYRWQLDRGVPLRDEDGNIVKWFGVTTDIEDRKRAEDKIREQESELRQIVDLAPQFVGVFGPNREGLFVNRVALDYFGLTLEEWRQRFNSSVHPYNNEFLHPDDRERVTGDSNRALSRGAAFELEMRLRKSDGSYRWFFLRYNPLHNEEGQITRWYVTGTDIEDRKQAEDRLRQENVALREEIDKASMFEELVGTSPALKSVLSRISKVAPSDSTVLITGETGTGKELVARAIHRRSDRASRAFVSVNCAAIPRDLIASELFGHEKGAFTGATQQRLGRFELASGGTIFLDEVGELPPETQIALLRVLQEHEFERVGGTRRIRADVRVIAATNRDLQAAITAGSFRSDLFYRLNVFPIEIPSLRERRADIPLLVEYFIDRYARKAGKNIKRVNKKTLELLESYPWPGNIRELQNVIERSMILYETEIFSIDENWLPQPPPLTPESKQQVELPRRLLVQEKDMIEEALKASRGRVFGPTGAAAKLGIPRSTLESKIKSLKIDKNRFKV